ncbi:hypothetical protein GCM10007938_38660 [Vibrio zhanjiangensis]|uniref:Uncharacterized protein n=1 Tax=Vibrio zhanjiangensis TaxID=1046128 RepID=A0ABQ6F3H8_9VIBR|nr:hypothetical protein GCM10007938_38660 [Vibrio zhanjiangensis]
MIIAFPVLANPQPNDEKLINSLIERNVICADQSYDEKLRSLQIYLANRFSSDKSIDHDTKQTTGEKLENKQCISAPKD